VQQVDKSQSFETRTLVTVNNNQPPSETLRKAESLWNLCKEKLFSSMQPSSKPQQPKTNS